VKDFMREYGKMAGFPAAGAFLLSLLLGLVSRNPFGVALTRAILFMILFAGLGGFAKYIIRKYLPEVTAAGPARAEATSGRNIDITLPEEKPPVVLRPSTPRASPAATRASPAAMTSGVEEAQSAAGAGIPPDEIESRGVRDAGLPGEGADLNLGPMGGDDLDAELPPLIDTAGTPVGESTFDPGTSTDSVEEAESVSEEGTGDAERGSRDSEPEMDSELQKLPDISSLGASRAPRGGGSAAQGRPGRSVDKPSTPGDEMKGALGGQDPATLARAIRTVLKRDEKG
jgi:hypothetical protein